MNQSRRRLVTAGLLALTLVGGSAGAATAKGDKGLVKIAGSCSGSTDWTLKVKKDDGRLEVELEIDANRAGQTWQVRMTDNGTRFFKGRRTTAGRSGSFDVERKTADRAGTDTIRSTARNVRSGETCTVELAYSR